RNGRGIGLGGNTSGITSLFNLSRRWSSTPPTPTCSVSSRTVFSAPGPSRASVRMRTNSQTYFPASLLTSSLSQVISLPFIRELCLSLGGCPSSAEAMSHILSRPGNALALVVGGASESLECHPGTYRIILKRRKGFIKLALMHGWPIIV
ncbi:hypothetical protein L9F63_021686, partial [Diploptera punctata]